MKEKLFTPAPWCACRCGCGSVTDEYVEVASATLVTADHFPTIRRAVTEDNAYSTIDEALGSICARFRVGDHIYEAVDECIEYGAVDAATRAANANLIAAAPDLYAIVQDLVNECGIDDFGGSYVNLQAPRDLQDRGEAALAKARGEAWDKEKSDA